MKKPIIYIIPMLLLLLAACTKDISSFNDQKKKPASVPPGPLFTNATRNLCDRLADCGGNNSFRHVVKHWGQAVIQDNAQYNFAIANMPDNWWTNMYRDVLADLKRSDSILSLDNTTFPATVTNQRAIVDIAACYTWNVLVNTFGNVPYTEALNPDNLFPKYDDAKTITLDLLARIDKDIAALNASAPGFAATEDLWYNGKVSSWIAFAHSLKLMIGMTLSDEDDTRARGIVEAANAQAFSSAATDAVMKYGSSTPNNNPTYTALVLANRTDFIAAKDLIDPMIAMSDPRLPGFFGKNSDGVYAGAVVGVPTPYASVSKPSARINAPDNPFVVLDYMAMEFYRAEAIERGYTISGTAEQHYDTAIAISIRYWGGSAADVNTYLSRPDVSYATAAGTPIQRIAYQKWIALYCRPFDGWTELRRLDYPALTLPVAPVSGFPNRMSYPATIFSEQTLNPDNYTQAAAAIGGDKVETRLYWDIH